MPMFLIRDVMHCKPGKVRPMVEKFKALEKVMKKIGAKNKFRILTDVSGERYWTVVAEIEADSLEGYAEMSRKTMSDKNLQKAMKGYHDLVDEGRREIFMIEK
jgi:hypothetical protein